MQETLTVEETISVAELVDSDPMLECLTQVDRQSWQALEDLFNSYSVEDKRKKFKAVTDQIQQDPIVKGKSLLSESFILAIADR